MSYLGDPSYFNRLIPGNVTIYDPARVTPPLYGDTWTMPAPGLTYEHLTPGLVYGPPAAASAPNVTPWSIVDINQLIALSALDADPEPVVQTAPEPLPAPSRRRAMVLDGDIPTGA